MLGKISRLSFVFYSLDVSFVMSHVMLSMQAPQKHQKEVAHVLGLRMSKVVCKTKRIGGGFGGKETRSAFLAAAASVPSYLLNRPVKLTLDRDIDMMITGQRHSFLGKYKVQVNYSDGYMHCNIWYSFNQYGFVHICLFTFLCCQSRRE